MTATVEVLEHTADIGLRVRAGDPAEAFGAMAEGMFDIIVDRTLVIPDRTWKIQVAAPGWTDLVISFLEELLYRYEAQGIVLQACSVSEIDDTHLVAKISGEQVDTGRHEFGVQIKAVTYHQLEAAPTARGFEIQVIFDI